MPSTRGHERDWAWRRRLRSNPATHVVYRAVVGVVGLVVVVVGLVLVPLAGPGWLIVLGGVAVWATEFHWAHRLKVWGLARLQEWTAWVARQALWVRGLLAGATAVLAAAIGVATVWWTGTPAWVPDLVEAPVDDLVATYLPAR